MILRAFIAVEPGRDRSRGRRYFPRFENDVPILVPHAERAAVDVHGVEIVVAEEPLDVTIMPIKTRRRPFDDHEAPRFHDSSHQIHCAFPK